jgi:hypothetical protein
MQLKGEEQVIKVYHHHPTCFVVRGLKSALLAIPFLVVAAFFSGLLSIFQQFIVYSTIILVFALLITYDLVLYYFDRMIITNIRIIHVDWFTAFKKKEVEAELDDIQDIKTEVGGILSSLPFFDHGLFSLETASTKTSIIFNEAPYPEKIKDLIYHLTVKPNRIGTISDSGAVYDTARQTYDEEAAVSRRQ